MKCPACHEEYDDQMEYCPFCGNDNPKVDPVGDDISYVEKVNSSSATKYEEMVVNTKDGGIYKLKFNVNDEYEKSAYDELFKIEDKRTGYAAGVVLTIIMAAIAAVLVSLSGSAASLIFGVILIAIGLPSCFICSFKQNAVARELTEKQLEYARYMIEKQGGKVRSVDKENLTLIYDINNETKYLAFRYRIYGNRYRRWSN